ncbi:hypothetical protein ATY76_04565 [Rhizobium sp. R339]|uniref:virion core protein, T7 gp14 family n=1 Tax=Rhizobium sp. R339 TaxID=1764273 RepID=UPI000B52BA51|nr:hypothetical protein [Rhizobium sp. R339]OWV77216.1 hypothetical protein ATY76_04565 [Rhizobium sp. R339]
MCDIGLALTLGSTPVGAAGSVQQGQAAKAAGKYNQQVAEMNAELSERRAQDALERGAQEEQRKRQEVARIMGAQTAAMAANGLDISFGSPLDTLVDTATLGELDALTIRTNAYREAYDFRVDAVNQRAGGTLERMKGDATAKGSYLEAAGTILTGAGKYYEKRYPTTATTATNKK